MENDVWNVETTTGILVEVEEGEMEMMLEGIDDPTPTIEEEGWGGGDLVHVLESLRPE